MCLVKISPSFANVCCHDFFDVYSVSAELKDSALIIKIVSAFVVFTRKSAFLLLLLFLHFCSVDVYVFVFVVFTLDVCDVFSDFLNFRVYRYFLKNKLLDKNKSVRSNKQSPYQ